MQFIKRLLLLLSGTALASAPAPYDNAFEISFFAAAGTYDGHAIWHFDLSYWPLAPPIHCSATVESASQNLTSLTMTPCGGNGSYVVFWWLRNADGSATLGLRSNYLQACGWCQNCSELGLRTVQPWEIFYTGEFGDAHPTEVYEGPLNFTLQPSYLPQGL